jgi:hypothetical protein
VNEAPEKMPVEKLEARIRFHESTARMYRDHGEAVMERKFQELANSYRRELERRAGAAAYSRDGDGGG